jgi:ArsR family metal-binding transcriptional regulator
MGESPAQTSGGLVVVFQARSELERALSAVGGVRDGIRVVEPPAEVADVAVPYLVVSDGARGAVHDATAGGALIAGQVWYREPAPDALADLGPEPSGVEDAVGRVAVAHVAPCIAEEDDLRLTAHVEKDLGPVMPYLNAEVRGGTYSPGGPTFTLMNGPRLINLFPHRIVVGRLREMQDAWRTLKFLKNMLSDVWSRRASIEPCHERRVQISPLELYQRLPGTNCRVCGEATCLAFAAKVLSGDRRLEACAPVFGGEHGHLRPALEDLAGGLGL